MSANKTPAAMAAEAPCKPRVRDRIFDTACDLFYQQGIRAVGVDTIASEAGTNKMSFYRSFSSKDDLVAEYLRQQVRELWEWWDEVVAKHPDDARTQIMDLFGAFVTKNCDTDVRGCALGNAAVEIREHDHPAHPVILEYKSELRKRWHSLAKRTGARKHEQLGDALMLLQEGGMQSRLVFCGVSGPLKNAAHAAQSLIKAHLDC